jgi:hypothetical protein
MQSKIKITGSATAHQDQLQRLLGKDNQGNLAGDTIMITSAIAKG